MGIHEGLLARLRIYQGDPTSRDLEVIAEIQERMRLVVLTRWMLLACLVGYLGYAGFFYLLAPERRAELAMVQIAVAGAAIGGVALFNLLLHSFYPRLSQYRYVNHLQILIDIFFVTLLVHFSGGVHSWFWAVYLLVTLESAFLLDRKREVWLLGAVGGLLYGALLTLEFYSILRPVPMPFVDQSLQHEFTFEMLMWFWVAIMNGTFAVIGAHLMGVIRRREDELKQLVIKDQMTGLYNRGYFYKMLNSEVQRSVRYGDIFSILLIDIDNFKKFNDTYGHLEGDKLLKGVANVFRENVRRSETDPSYDVDIPCRYGGEEFAIILPRTSVHASHRDSALTMAERVRHSVEELIIDHRHTTVSIGIATFPLHGDEPDMLVKRADDALYKAKAEGRNCVRVAELPGTSQAI